MGCDLSISLAPISRFQAFIDADHCTIDADLATHMRVCIVCGLNPYMYRLDAYAFTLIKSASNRDGCIAAS